MSNFQCLICGKNIIYTSSGYITGCKHYPLEDLNKNKSKINKEAKNIMDFLMGFKK
jgi:hypothetical protein